MKLSVKLFFFICLLASTQSKAQWRIHNGTNSPFEQGIDVYKLGFDDNSKKVWASAYKYPQGNYLWEYTETNGWSAMSNLPFSTLEGIVSIKFRNNIWWCLTTKNLYKYENNSWQKITLPSGYTIPQTIDGLYVDNKNVWFVSGIQGKGLTKYDGVNFTTYNSGNTAGFKQDDGITDISMNEQDSILWVSSNCVGGLSGVASFDIKNDTWKLYDNGDAKYGCVHAVAPIKDKIIVGTCNFSSIRILNTNGVYTQSLEGTGKVNCVNIIEADPDNENWAWVTTDYKLIHFKDTLHYQLFDTSNTILKGTFIYVMAVQKKHNDSSRVWLTTSKGLFSYTYSSKEPPVTGVDEAVSIINAIEVYPNPSKGIYNLSAITDASKFSFDVRNITGQSVNYQLIKTAGGTSINISELPAGIYTLAISDGISKVFRKLILTE
jgi:hypothetical protein